MRINNAKNFILVALLLISFFMNLFLYQQMRGYYTLLYAVELDPLGLSYFQNGRGEQSSEQPIIVFFGDSRAAQWINPTVEGFTFLNRGIGNQTSAQVINRFHAHIKPLKPKVIVIQVGVNDLKTIPLFPERKQEIISNCKNNIQEIVQDSLEVNATVVLTTIFPTGKVSFPRSLVWSNDVDEAIKEVNRYILSLSGNNVVVFDTTSILSNGNGKVKPEYRYDLLHLNELGYQVLNVELEKILGKIE
jgi:lysophospholipase L1-like esterase